MKEAPWLDALRLYPARSPVAPLRHRHGNLLHLLPKNTRGAPCPSLPSYSFVFHRAFSIPIFLSSVNGSRRESSGSSPRLEISCRATVARESPPAGHASLRREPHKYFDQVFVAVRSGDGGHGAVLALPSPRAVSKTRGKGEKKKTMVKTSFKRDSDGSLILPVAGNGGDVVVYADESMESLLEFHQSNRYSARRGGNVDAMGPLTSLLLDGSPAPALRIPVPVGTVVKRKNGKFLADLAKPSDEVLVARGGRGGISLLETPENRRQRSTYASNVTRDRNDKNLVLGQPGEEIMLEFILRVVADVGLVGLPNAGKSTLLASITLAKPSIANYPFTTLMPNLGCLDGDPKMGACKYSSEATLVDLPGLIEGAHLGKGLGRNFLRHLRRTRLLVHVVDAAAEDPVNDYRTVREELRMYNPCYLERPYIVVLNKIDLPEACNRLGTLIQEISSIGRGRQSFASQERFLSELDLYIKPSECVGEGKEKKFEDYPPPLAVVGASLLKHIGVDSLLEELRSALRKLRDQEVSCDTDVLDGGGDQQALLSHGQQR